MKIIIAGAGDMGFHLAELLSFENQDIVLIDSNQDVLDYANSHLDVMTIRGDAASLEILEQANVEDADLLLAVTTSEKTNLVSAILAKKKGARQTIARVNNQEHLLPENRAIFQELGIDNLISPRALAAEEIYRLIQQCTFTDVFDFEEGKMSLVGITLDSYSPLVNTALKDIGGFSRDVNLRPIAILRGHSTIIPHGDTVLRSSDHIYFITKQERIDSLQQVIGKKQIKVKKVMILGGSEQGLVTARRLENEYSVTLIERNKDRCKRLSEYLNNTLIVNGEYSNFDLMEEEGLGSMDAFIALTDNAETNIIACLTAKNHGVYKTIAQVENKEYTHVSQNIGVDTLINKKLIAANNIFRYVRKGRVEAITSLHGVDAEIIEYIVHKNNQLTRKPLKDLHFPTKALIGGVIRGEESLIPDGEFQLQRDDRVIVFAMPESINRLEQLFR
ncbi:MAG: Trk system potassium transporter TrkA [Lewinellaceae bacterium]|nr:Trk system potassium transporter TrkA [Lewinellaceae bacterium]